MVCTTPLHHEVLSDASIRPFWLSSSSKKPWHLRPGICSTDEDTLLLLPLLLYLRTHYWYPTVSSSLTWSDRQKGATDPLDFVSKRAILTDSHVRTFWYTHVRRFSFPPLFRVKMRHPSAVLSTFDSYAKKHTGTLHFAESFQSLRKSDLYGLARTTEGAAFEAYVSVGKNLKSMFSIRFPKDSHGSSLLFL